MKHETTGTITIVQETRFWLTNTVGVGQHFTVAHDADLPETPLQELGARDVRVVVEYTQSANQRSHIAHVVKVAD